MTAIDELLDSLETKCKKKMNRAFWKEKEKAQIIKAFEEGQDYERKILGKVDHPALRYYHTIYKW